MKLIIGLGNPGKEYEHTRHNVGFDVLDLVANQLNIDFDKTGFKGVYGKGKYFNYDLILFKPHTFMNLSGTAVIEIMKFYKIDIKDIIVISDDLALDIGKIRLRGKGSAGGHNGLKDIIKNLGNRDDFVRVKVGIGKPQYDIVNFVLSKFNEDEQKIMDESFKKAKDAVLSILEIGLYNSMSKFN